jgi:hypothetical protein
MTNGELQATPHEALMAQLMDPNAPKSEREHAAVREIERLRSDLISCRGTVKTERNHYERQAMVHGKTPHGATYEAEAQRLAALLDRIDSLMPQEGA